ncbi:hypothetical protein FRC11_014497, partial [Ceratobasidium sp. 423]
MGPRCYPIPRYDLVELDQTWEDRVGRTPKIESAPNTEDSPSSNYPLLAVPNIEPKPDRF